MSANNKVKSCNDSSGEGSHDVMLVEVERVTKDILKHGKQEIERKTKRTIILNYAYGLVSKTLSFRTFLQDC